MTVGDLDRIFKAYDVRGVVPDDLDEGIARRIGAAFAEWSRRAERGDRPGLPALVSRSRRRARRGHHLAGHRRHRPRARLHRPALLRVRIPRPARDHAHREPQPEAVQRAEVLPRGREARGRGERAARGASADGAGPAAHRRARARSSIAICSPPTSSTCSRSWTPRACGRSPWPSTPPTAWEGSSRPRSSSGCRSRCTTSSRSSTARSRTTPRIRSNPENQRDLKAAVLQHEADIGLAFDGDADRVFLIDERGAGRERFDRDGARRQGDAQARAGSEDHLQPHLLLDRARGDRRERRCARSHPRRSFVHQAGHGGDGRDLRGRALRPLLLPGELPRGLRADRRGGRAWRSSRRRTSRSPSCSRRSGDTRRRARSTPKSRIRTRRSSWSPRR